MNETNVARDRPETDGAGTRQVELRVRERTPACVTDVIERVTDRLRRLEGEEVDGVRVECWGQRRLGAPEELVTTTVAEYREWAERHGYSLDPAFRRRETGSLLSQDSRSEVVVPTISLAVYEDGELQCVTPCSDGTATYTVEECLEALEAGVTDLSDALAKRERSSTDADLERGRGPA
ncbi:HTH domain-containing protein [Natrialbaceae archaeon A-gly3]